MKHVIKGLLGLAAYGFAAVAFANNDVSVPEPGTFGLLAAGIAAIVAVRLIKRK